MKIFLQIIICFLLIFPSPYLLYSAVTGICSNCHTMHNSQAGISMMRPGASGPIDGLLRSDCLGCHTGTNTDSSVLITDAFDAPFVLQTTSAPIYGTGVEATSQTLAGGNFYWVDVVSEYKGHNVQGIESTSRTAPGGTFSGPLKCAGSSGCHGDRSVADEYASMSGGHHESPAAVVTGYRLLDGVSGFEDSDWEWHPTTLKHNQYKGKVRTTDDDTDTTTMAHFCSKCHGNFHNGSGAGAGTVETDVNFSIDPWIRHPVDFDMNGVGGEYSSYNSDGKTYSVIAPVASTDVSAAKSLVLQGAGDAIISCLSCHRAHGTPFDHNLRWDYKGWPGGGYPGCQICHTSKN